MCSEIINNNLRKLARLRKLLEQSEGRPEFERLLQKYEAIYDTISNLINLEMDRLVPPATPGELSRKTRWGIPIPDGWNPDDPVFQRHPRECDCFCSGVLRCGVACVWAWPPGARLGSKAMRLNLPAAGGEYRHLRGKNG